MISKFIKKYRLLLYVAIAMCLTIVCSSPKVMGQDYGDLLPASQIIRPYSISIALLDTNLTDTLAFVDANGRVRIADSALALRDGILRTSAFVASSLDSLIKLMVDSSDYARALRAGAITNRSPFSAAAFDSIQNHWVLYSPFAGSAASALTAGSATTATTATNALNYIGSNPVPEATHSATSDYASVAGTAVASVTELSADIWADIIDSLEAYSLVSDSVHYSKVSDSLRASAIDVGSVFTTAIKDTYLTNIDQNKALDYSHAPSQSNMVLTKSHGDTLYPKNLSAGMPVTIGFYSAVAPSAGVFAIDSNGTGPAVLTSRDWSGQTYWYPDCTVVADMVKDSAAALRALIGADCTLVYNYATDVGDLKVAKGLNDFPSQIDVSTAEPLSPQFGDLWVSMGDSITYVYDSSSTWVSVGGTGGGGGTPTQLSTNRFGTIDADSIFFGFRDGATDSVRLGTTVFTNNVQIDDTLSAVKIKGDTLDNKSTQDTVWVKTNILPTSDMGFSIGTLAKRLYNLYCANYYGAHITADGNLVVTGNITSDGGGYLLADDIRPYAGAATTDDTLGYSAASHNTTLSYNAFLRNLDIGQSTARYFEVTNAAAATILAGSLTLNNSSLGISGADGNFTWNGVSGGTFRVWEGELDVNEIFSEGYISMAANTGIQFGGDGYLNWTTAGDPDITCNGGNASDGRGADSLYFLDEAQNASIDASCPTPGATNPLVTSEALRINNVYFGAPALFHRTILMSNRKAWWTWYQTQIGTDCQADSMYWPDDFAYSALHNTRLTIYPTDTLDPHYPDDPPPDMNPAMLDDYQEPVQFGFAPVGPAADSLVMMYPIMTGNNPVIRGEYVVGDQYDDSTGTLTGYFKTLTAALDSLPHIVVKSTRVNDDSVYLYLSQATEALRPRLFYGDAVADTMTSIPKRFGSPGSYFCSFLTAGGDSCRSWNMIDHWVNDSVFVVSGKGDTWGSSTTDAFGVIAQNMLISPGKPVNGGALFLEDTVIIHMDHSPVTIRGLGADVTAITNAANGYSGAPGVTQMFKCISGASNDYGYGLPITFENMTIYNVDTTSDNPNLQLSGKIKFNDVKIGGRAKEGKYVIGFDSPSELADIGVSRGMQSLELNNVDMAQDSDVVCIYIADTLVSFSARNCEFLYDGNGGLVFKANDPCVGGRREFSHCTFYGPPTASVTPFTVVAGDSIFARSCDFLGTATYTTTGANEYIIGSVATMFNYEDTTPTNPPARLDRSSWRYQFRSLPK